LTQCTSAPQLVAATIQMERDRGSRQAGQFLAEDEEDCCCCLAVTARLRHLRKTPFQGTCRLTLCLRGVELFLRACKLSRAVVFSQDTLSTIVRALYVSEALWGAQLCRKAQRRRVLWMRCVNAKDHTHGQATASVHVSCQNSVRKRGFILPH
jgi:hypothetical protein